MDYSPLVKAIQEGDQKAANKLISEATPILIRMLRFRMGASREDAEDAVQLMFLNVIRAIRLDKINNPSGLLSYMIRASRNNYLKSLNGYHAAFKSQLVQEPVQEPTQLTSLIELEKRQEYESCIESLKPKHRDFIRYWLTHPDSTAADVAEIFGITESNAWTRKHRILKKVKECVQKKR